MAQFVYIYIFQSAKNQCSVVAIFDVRKEWTLFWEKHQKFLKIFVLLWHRFFCGEKLKHEMFMDWQLDTKWW
jgi:hypothetical protein